MALTHVVAYDISEDQRRAQVAAVLQAHGDRIQRSVFICVLEPEAMRQLSDRLAGIINPRTDSVYVFRQCAACWGGVTVLGQADVAERTLYWAVL